MVKDDKSVLDDDRIGRLLTKMAIPVFLSTAVTLMYNVISTVFVGHYVGSLAIGGIAFVAPIQVLGMAFAQLFGVGGASIVSRAIGAGDRDRAERALGNSLLCIIVISVLVMIIGLANPVYWLKLLGASSDILTYAGDYFRIVLFGMIFQNAAQTLSSLITAEGKARVSMTGMVIGSISNILFDIIFVVILKWGVKGAAVGTVLAQLLSTAYMLNYYYRGKSFLKIHIRKMAVQWGIIGGMASIGVSVFFMDISWSVSGILLNEALVIYGGGIAVSAYGIVSRLVSFSTLPGMSIGLGMQPILGFNYGKKRYDRVLRVLKMTLVTTSIFSICIFFLFQIIPAQIAGIFTRDAELISLAAYATRRVFSTNMVTGFIITGICTFQSLGKARQSFLISLRTVVFLLPFVLILPHFFKLDGVFFAYPLTEVCGFMLALGLMVFQIRQLRRLNAAGQTVKPEAVPSMDAWK